MYERRRDVLDTTNHFHITCYRKPVRITKIYCKLTQWLDNVDKQVICQCAEKAVFSARMLRPRSFQSAWQYRLLLSENVEPD